MSDGDASDHLAQNRAAWSSWAAAYGAPGRRGRARSDRVLGIWGGSESTLGVLPDVAGLDVVGLGCGTAYVSAWLARAGARPVGLDPTAAQLATARVLQREFGLVPAGPGDRRSGAAPRRGVRPGEPPIWRGRRGGSRAVGAGGRPPAASRRPPGFPHQLRAADALHDPASGNSRQTLRSAGRETRGCERGRRAGPFPSWLRAVPRNVTPLRREAI